MGAFHLTAPQPIDLGVIRESFEPTLHEVRITRLFVNHGEVVGESNMSNFEASVTSLSCNETLALQYL